MTLLVPGADWLLGGGASQDISQISSNIPELSDKTRNDFEATTQVFLQKRTSCGFVPEVLFNFFVDYHM